MCGRCACTLSPHAWMTASGASRMINFPGKYRPRYNVCPSTHLPLVYQVEDLRILTTGKWGHKRYGHFVINARAESCDTGGMFRGLKRCVVLMDAFFEWNRGGGAKYPMDSNMRRQANVGV
eukprot:GHVO01069970.1.p1 GENE.GHVO01069970.1~~GHVO01069970.1.p1  ORF type:complete len:130 (+),score=19.34 GHVO01069970.1:30-392(+)